MDSAQIELFPPWFRKFLRTVGLVHIIAVLFIVFFAVRYGQALNPSFIVICLNALLVGIAALLLKPWGVFPATVLSVLITVLLLVINMFIHPPEIAERNILLIRFLSLAAVLLEWVMSVLWWRYWLRKRGVTRQAGDSTTERDIAEKSPWEKRQPVTAGLLSLLCPGLGQMYNTQLKKGIVLFIACQVISMVMLAMRLPVSFSGGVTYVAAIAVIYAFITADAFRSARRIKQVEMKKYNRWYYYVLFVVLAVTLFSLADSVTIKRISEFDNFRIASSGMEPTLEEGDRCIADLRAYRHEQPKRNDVILFRHPEDPSRTYIKRIMAVEGDIIESRNKTIYINGARVDEPYAMHSDSTVVSEKAGPRDNFGPFTVPSGTIFVLGDNRDWSYDSRHFGYVGADDIIGKALYVYWSWDRKTVSVRFGKIGTSP